MGFGVVSPAGTDSLGFFVIALVFVAVGLYFWTQVAVRWMKAFGEVGTQFREGKRTSTGPETDASNRPLYLVFILLMVAFATISAWTNPPVDSIAHVVNVVLILVLATVGTVTLALLYLAGSRFAAGYHEGKQ